MMKQILEKLKGTNWLGIIGNSIIIVAVFLPLVEVEFLGTYSVSWIKANGVFVLILAIMNLILLFSDKLATKISFMEKLNNPKWTLIPTAIILILLLIITLDSTQIIRSSMQVKESEAYYLSYLSKYIHLGIGFYLAWVGVIFSSMNAFFSKKETV